VLTDEEHSTMIVGLYELQARITMRHGPSHHLATAIRVLEQGRVREKELERLLAEAKSKVVHPPPDSLY
jgi:hypothetical protein